MKEKLSPLVVPPLGHLQEICGKRNYLLDKRFR
jgi:hypothetical protein